MNRSLAVVAAAALLFACKQSSKPTKPPAMSPAVDVSAVIVGGEGYPDQPLDDGDREIAVGFDGTSYLVAWTQPGGVTLDDIWAARMTASGALIGDPFPVSTSPGNQQTPAVAFDGEGWLVVFQDHRAGPYLNIYGARVRADGTVLDPDGLPIATQTDHQATPAVAFDGTSFVVVWADRRSIKWDIYGARVARDGTVQDLDGFVIAVASSQQRRPAVAFDGTNHLVVWEDMRLGGSYDVRAARVTPAGVVLDADGILVSGAALGQSAPALAFDGQNFVVAWEDLRGGVTPRVYAARVTSAGAVLDADGILVSPDATAGSNPAVAFDGAYTLVAWQDESVLPARVHGARIDEGGTVLDPAAFLIASGTEGEALAAASDGAGRALVAYDFKDPTTAAVRVRGRVLTDWALLSVAKSGRGAGVVTSTPEGIACGESCAHRFDAPTEVSLAAAPDADSVFGGWSGACEGTAGCSVTTDEAKAVTARFLALYPLTVSLGSAITGTVASQPAGIACGSACSSRFPEGTTVELTATGTPGYSVFSAWTGDCQPSVALEDPQAKAKCAVLVDGPTALTATFLRAYTVTLATSGTGAGAVALGATTCNSGSVCKVDVAAGTEATFTAAPGADSVFKSWQGCFAGDPTTPRVCTGTITGTRTVTARFERSTIALTATTFGNGRGTVSGAGLACTTGSTAGCTAAVPNPADSTSYTTVELTATPSPDSVFKSWMGCTADPVRPNVCTATMNGARTVTAKFETSTIPLTATTSGTGSGTVTGAGLACASGSTAGCTTAVPNPPDSYAYTLVTLTATASPGSVFKAWSGCSVVPEDPSTCTVTVGSARTVGARFEPDRVPLTAVTGGTGAGTVSGAGLACTTGSTAGCTAAVENPPFTTGYATVTLTATPSPGSVFKAWIGCNAVEGAPATCTTTAFPGKSVTARFEPAGFALTATTSGTGAGTVTGAGLACTTGSTEGCATVVANPDNSGAYETVTLYATGSAGSVFKSWTGCAAIPDSNGCTVSMNVARAVTAKFEPDTVPLNASTTGTGVGTISGVGLACTSGSTAGCVGAAPNPVNTPGYATVTVTATPAAGSVFKQWTGCTPVDGAPDTCTLTASPGRLVSARFEPDAIPVTASSTGAGAGTISGAGLACTTGSSDGCTALVNNPGNTSSYETVTLTAVGASGSVFKSWSGCSPVAGTNTCTLTVNAAKTVSARFEPGGITLTAATTGTGAGTITGAGLACTTGSSEGCTTLVNNPVDTTSYETVTLAAVGAPGSVFKSWSGCSPVAGTNTCTVVVNGAKSVSARFEPSTIALSASTTGTASGTITGAGLACTTGSSEGCTTLVNNPVDTTSYETVTLTAVAAPGAVFKSWSGCAPVTGTNSCTVVVNGAKSVSARFEPATIQLGIVTVGTGAGTVTGPGLACTTGSSEGCTAAIENPANTSGYTYVTLTAAASPGSVFKYWSNCAPNTDPPQSCTVFVNQVKTVTATFAAQ